MSHGNSISLRTIDPGSAREIETIAHRMRLTLIEVLGPERGTEFYTKDWLIDRVRFHLDPQQCQGQIFVAADAAGELAGHSIVRVEEDDYGEPYGLFSTTYVVPEYRRLGWAEAFLRAGEAWMQTQCLHRAATATALHNKKLIQLYQKHGYQLVYSNSEMLRLEKCLS